MNAEVRSYLDAIDWLWQAGLRFGSAIDLGCADGQFSVFLAEGGPLRNSVLLNVDAQDEYRDSLIAIQTELGGHYRFCAVGEHDGETVALNSGAHPYWASLRQAGDSYWRSINDLRGQSISVPLRSLDSLVAEMALPGPHLVKMDIQGGETAALAGGKNALRNTAAVVLEIVTEDFATIHASLCESGFELFDLSNLSYPESGALGWFYATYLSARYSYLRPSTHWSPGANDGMLFAQNEQRSNVRAAIAQSLARKRAGQWSEVVA
jgi:FkbM family methyltransferase